MAHITPWRSVQHAFVPHQNWWCFIATRTIAPGGGNWNATATWQEGAVPTAADDVVCLAGGLSGNLTLNTTGNCQSINFTNYTKIFTMSGQILNVGSASGGNITFVAGMTLTTSSSSQLNCVATTTGFTFTTGGKTIPPVNFNGTGGGWTLQDAFTTAATSTVTLTAGTLNTNGKAVTTGGFLSSNANTRTLTLGASTFTLNGAALVLFDTTTNTGLTFNANTSTVVCNGATTAGANTLTPNGVTFNNLTITGDANKTCTYNIGAAFTVSGTLTINGNSILNRVLVESNTVGTSRIITCNGTVTVTNADFMDITGAGTASWNLSAITGGSGNCQGNSGITFTTATTNYRVGGGATANWDTVAGWASSSGGAASSGRVPLPQDTARIDANSGFSSGNTLQSNAVPRLGASINFTGAPSGLIFNITTAATTIFGNLTLVSGLTLGGNFTITFAGRSSQTITSAGISLTAFLTINAPGGTYTMQDALTITQTLTLSAGTFVLNGFNLTINSFTGNGGTLNGGTSTVNLTKPGVGGVFNNISSSMVGAFGIVIVNAASANRSFVGGGATYGSLTYTVAGSTGALNITDANTFGTINVSDASGGAHTLVLPAGKTTTVTNSFNVYGTGLSSLRNITSSTSGTAAILSKAGAQVSCDYVALTDITATGGASFVAYASTNVSGNTGWLFGNLRTIATTGGNWSSTATWVEAAVPTAADRVVATSTSGQLTVNTAAVCREFDMTNYANTVTLSNTQSLTMGDATGGQMKLVSAMTLTLSGGTISLISTSNNGAVGWPVATGGLTLPSTTYNGAGGSWVLQNSNSTSSASTVTLTAGTLNTNNQTCSWGIFSSSNSNVRALTLGASAITITGSGTPWDCFTSTNFTLSAGTSSITCPGAGITFNGGELTYNNLALSGSGIAFIGGAIANSALTFANLTRTGTAVKTDGMALATRVTATGTATLTGNSVTNRLLIQSNALGTARTLSAAAVSITNVDFQDITGAGAASSFTGTSLGDCQGNTGITFTTAASQTWSGNTTGNWSTSANWTSRVPLPQDNVAINGLTSGTVTADMPRLGANIDLTSSSGGNFNNNVQVSIFGSLTLVSGISFGFGNPCVFSGRSSYTITNASKSFSSGVLITAPSGTYTLQDTLTTTGNFTLTNGTFNANNNNLSAATVISTGAATRTMTMGSGTWSLTGTTATNLWNTTSTGLTLNVNTAIVTCTGAPGSATTATITTGGVTMPNFTVNVGTNLTVQLADNFTATGATLTLTNGTLNTNGVAVTALQFASSNSNTRTLTLGASIVTLTQPGGFQWDTLTTTNFTFNPNTSTIVMSGASNFRPGGLTFNNVSVTGNGCAVLSTFTCVNFTVTATAIKTFFISLAASFTVTGTFTATGNSLINRLLVQSNTVGTSRTITAAAVSLTNVDFMDITGGGAASPFTGTSLGDCQGNSGITFDTPVAQTWSGNTTGNWSASANWTSRVPLPQDNVVINGLTSGTATVDMPRLGKSIDLTSSSGGTFALSSLASLSSQYVFGSLTLVSGITLTGNQAVFFGGRSSYTITSAGKAFAATIQFFAPGGTYTLQDALNTSAALVINNGTFTTNNLNVTCQTFTTANTGAVNVVNLGTSTVTITHPGPANLWNVNNSNTTLSAASSTIVFATAGTGTKSFLGFGKTYGTLTYTVAGSTGALVITGANTFNTINFSDASNARTLTLPVSTTNIITNLFNVNGTAGKLMTINSSTAGIQATLSKASGTVTCDYLSIQDSAATGGATWVAGANSTNVSNNTGWIFGALSISGWGIPI